jgi:uncharacterized coiled-coil protein SlyX
LEIENLGKRSGVIDTSISNRIQEIEERISGTDDTIENIETTVKENVKCKNLLTQNIQKIQDTMKRPNLRIIGIEESSKGQQTSSTKLWKKTSITSRKKCPIGYVFCLTEAFQFHEVPFINS